MPLKLMMSVTLMWSAGVFLDWIVIGTGDSDRLAVLNELAAVGSFSTFFEGFGVAIPLPNASFVLAALNILSWNFSFFEGPWEPLRIIPVLYSVGVAAYILDRFGPALLGSIRGLLSFLPGF